MRSLQRALRPWIFVPIGLFLFAGSAAGSPRDPSAAEAVFQSGRQALARGDIDTACARFAESHRLDPAPGTLLNYADCEERRGKFATAQQAFRDSASTFRPGDDRVEYAERRAHALEPRVAHVVLRLREPLPGATVYRDDIELGAASLGVSLPLDPGRHRFVVRRPGYEEQKVELDFAAGESREVVLELGRPGTAFSRGPLPVPSPGARSSGPDAGRHGQGQSHATGRSSSRATWGYVAAGVGGAALVTGIVATFGVASAASTYKEHCHDGICDGEGLDAASRGKTFSLIAPIGFAVAAVGLGAGAYLIFPRPSSSASASSAGVSVVGTF